VNARIFRERLLRRAKRSGVTIDADLTERLGIYYQLLATWNLKINLTGMDLRDPQDEAFDRLLIEPLVAAKHMAAGVKRMLDIGSGGGSPAIPLRLATPAARLAMVESKTRKSVFLREVLRELKLPGDEVITGRFEELLSHPELHEAHDVVTVRAVRVEPHLLTGLQAFLRVGGQLLLFRGPGRADGSDPVHPPLAWKATYPLVEPLRSRLIVLEKRMVGAAHAAPAVGNVTPGHPRH
jgi:16S rRNA (guanine527-N7)-methyltransferase